LPDRTDIKPEIEHWQQACLMAQQQALAGRMVGGTIHNLNGIVQGLTLQTELLQMMFAHVRDLLADVDQDNCDERIDKISSLLAERAPLVDTMHDRVCSAGKILRTNYLKAAVSISAESKPIDLHLLASIIEQEIDFFMADSFFKHKIIKHVDLEQDFPVFISNAASLHIISAALIDNAISALKETDSSKLNLSISLGGQDEILELIVADSGPGVAPDIEKVMYNPFTSGWIDHSGLGLFYVSQFCHQHGWGVDYRREGGISFFTIKIPLTRN